MPKPRARLSKEEKNRRRRARAAELRAQKIRRSEAAKRGWETRRERQRLRDENERLQARVAELEKEVIRERVIREVMTGQRPGADLEKVFTPEERAEGRRQLHELFFGQETEEARQARMRDMWREADALVSGRGVSRFGQLLLWIERNGFEQKEFWAEYRRRKGK